MIYNIFLKFWVSKFNKENFPPKKSFPQFLSIFWGCPEH